jgi:apolipoprotein N-acyltransferase
MKTDRLVTVGLTAIPGVAFFLGEARPWENGLVLALLTLATGAGTRSLALLLSTCLFWASTPHFQLATYFFCLSPLFWLWRYHAPTRKWIPESFLVGFACAWPVSAFIRTSVPTCGLLLQVFSCILGGVQFVGLGAGIVLGRNLPSLRAAVLAGLVATACELLQAVYGFGWCCVAISLPAASTPWAQWASQGSPFAVSFLMYVVNFLWCPDFQVDGWRRWRPPAVALAVAVLAWFGGRQIADATVIDPLRFSALIVQPGPDSNLPLSPSVSPPSSLPVLHRLTRSALAQGTSVDLIIWPESSLALTSVWNDQLDCEAPSPRSSFPRNWTAGPNGDMAEAVGNCNLGDFYRSFMPLYKRPFLLGDRVITATGQTFNSACLIQPDGTASRHDKGKLVPVVETLPSFLRNDWVQTNVAGWIGAADPFDSGTDFHLLYFKARTGQRITLAASICYEMYFPWLPQFQSQNRADAIVHLTNESWCRGYPSYWQFETWACQYRAIETRSWQLVCTTMGNSAVIDPRGTIRASLEGKAGVIRTASLFADPGETPTRSDR